MGHEQLLAERTEPRTSAGTEPTGVKTILVHVADDDQQENRLQTALSLARAASAHLSFVHVTPIEAYVAFDNFGGVFVMKDLIANLETRNAELQSEIEDRLAGEDVSWDYEQTTGNVMSALISRASLADLVITMRHPKRQDFVGPTTGFLGELLQRSRTPVLVPAAGTNTFDPTGPALIAWNGSFEAANAVRASLGMLRLASDVSIIHVPETKADAKAFPGTRLVEYLSRQGIHAELTVTPPPTGDAAADVVAGMIESQALGGRAAYLVMGGYSHSRIGEYFFGGVTRTMLQDCPLPLLIAG